MMAFTNTEIVEKSLFLGISADLLLLFSIGSFLWSSFRKQLRSSEINRLPVWQEWIDFIMFLAIGWMVGTITFHHLISTNSLTLSYLIAVVCGIIGAEIPYFIHRICSPDDIIVNVPLNDEEWEKRDEIGKIVINANMWEYLAVGILPLVILLIRC